MYLAVLKTKKQGQKSRKKSSKTKKKGEREEKDKQVNIDFEDQKRETHF
jgi:hypothetical protein